jgi:hypothetical protein
MLEYYKSMPDYLPVIQLKELFEEFLTIVSSIKYEYEEALESLLELADRQWHTYEMLDMNVRNQVETWLISIFNKDSINGVEYVTLIIGRLGLLKVFEYVKKLLEEDLTREIRVIIHETIKELEGHVENPYFGMKS